MPFCLYNLKAVIMHAKLSRTQRITDWFDENQIKLNDTWLQAFSTQILTHQANSI